MSQQFFELNAEAKPLREDGPLFGDDRRLIQVAVAIGVVMTLWRLFMIFNTDMMWDEAHFIVSGRHPALGYPDIPGGFPWLAGLFGLVFQPPLIALRLLALLITTAVPVAVWFMAKAVVQARSALWAATIAMLLPAMALNGAIFYPEGTIQLLLALMCGCLVRAMNRQSFKWWALTGVCALLGLLTHFRFLIPGLGILLYLVVTPQGRGLWRTRGLYIAAALALAGLLPSLIYNQVNGWPALAYHVVNRTKFAFHPDFVVSFITVQILAATPVFLVAAAAALVAMLGKGRDRAGAVLAWISATIFVFYCLLALVDKRVLPHWAWLAFVPAVAFIPDVLIGFADAARTRGARTVRMVLIALGPILGICAGLGVSMVAYVTAHAGNVPYGDRQAAADTNEDWSLVLPALQAADHRARQRFGDAVLAAGGHRAAARLEVLTGRPVYAMAEPYDDVARFVVARRLWRQDYAGLVASHPKGVVLIVQEPASLYNDPDAVAYYEGLCREFDAIESASEVDLPPGRAQVHVYTATVRTSPAPVATPLTCPLFPVIYIGKPLPGVFVTSNDHKAYFGMAADAKGITKVEVLIDNAVAAPTQYGLDPAGARAPDALSYDPNYPRVQFSFSFPPGSLKPGQHVLSLRTTRSDGTTVNGAGQTLYVK